MESRRQVEVLLVLSKSFQALHNIPSKDNDSLGPLPLPPGIRLSPTSVLHKQGKLA